MTAAILARALVLGVALGAIGTAGTSVVLPPAGTRPLARALILATILVAFGIGLWAGAPQAEEEEVRPSERWLSAAALAAVGGSFATLRALYEPLYPGVWWSLATLILVLAIPVYAAALITPPLLAWGERRLDDEEVVQGWGALGPLVLGIVFGVALGLVVSGLAALPGSSPAGLMIAAALVLLLPLAFPDRSRPSRRETVLYETVSPFAELRVTEVVYPGERQAERRLYLNGEEESGELVRSGAPTLGYIAAAEHWLSEVTPGGARYLVLGGGAYTLPRRIAERDHRARVTVVEIDPAVTRIAERFFGLQPTAGITTVHADARAFLDRAAAGAYDRIFLDVYSGAERLPLSLRTKEAAAAIARALADHGIFVANVIGAARGGERRQLWSIVRTFASVFPTTALYSHLGRDFPERQNFLLAGGLEDDLQVPSRAGGFELWPREEWDADDGAVIYRDVSSTESAASSASPPSVPARA